MDWLNYHHLLYFWMVAKEGGLGKAAEKLHLAQPTLSSQIKKLEQSLRIELFNRSGRRLVLTEEGQKIYRYADEIFNLGRELQDTLAGRPADSAVRFTVGVPDGLPKIVVYQLLKPAIEMNPPVHLVCFEGKLKDLLADLALHRLDIVLADSPVTPEVHVRAFNHLLGDSGVSIFATAPTARKYRRGFPDSLNNAPMLLPTQNTTLRRALEAWFETHRIAPSVVHEFEDSATLKVFGQNGEGLFASPTIIEEEICRQYRVSVVGRIDDISEKFYAISVERRLKHPAVVHITESAKANLFSS